MINKAREVLTAFGKLSEDTPNARMVVDGKESEQVDRLKDLGTTASSNCCDNPEMKSGTGQAKVTFIEVKSYLTDENLFSLSVVHNLPVLNPSIQLRTFNA